MPVFKQTISNMPKRALRPKGLEKRFHQGCGDKRREGIPNDYRAFILGQLLTESISYNSHSNSRTYHRRKWGSGSLGAPLKHMDQSWDANINLPVPKAHTPSARPSPPILERILFFFFFFRGRRALSSFQGQIYVLWGCFRGQDKGHCPWPWATVTSGN